MNAAVVFQFYLCHVELFITTIYLNLRRIFRIEQTIAIMTFTKLFHAYLSKEFDKQIHIYNMILYIWNRFRIFGMFIINFHSGSRLTRNETSYIRNRLY